MKVCLFGFFCLVFLGFFSSYIDVNSFSATLDLVYIKTVMLTTIILKALSF